MQAYSLSTLWPCLLCPLDTLDLLTLCTCRNVALESGTERAFSGETINGYGLCYAVYVHMWSQGRPQAIDITDLLVRQAGPGFSSQAGEPSMC